MGKHNAVGYRYMYFQMDAGNPGAADHIKYYHKAAFMKVAK